MAKPKLALIPATQGSKLYSVLPADGVGDFDFTRSSSATRINAQGLIETVASGVSRLNYPLIDGVVNGCPSHLLEPTSTNLFPYSQSFQGWSDTGTNTTTVQDSAISPDGSINALKVKGSSDVDNNGLSTFFTITAGVQSYSIFAKKGEINILQVGFGGTFGSSYANVNLTNGVVEVESGQTTTVSEFSNGWYRITSVATATAGSGYWFLNITDDPSMGRNGDYIGNGTDGLYLFGAQTEQGSFSTSYIPNYGTSAGITRSAETANGAGDASTFNDSEGVLMAEISALANDSTNRFMSISDGTIANRINIVFDTSNNINARQAPGGVNISTSGVNILNSNKIAYEYQSGSQELWVNGFKIGTRSVSTLPSGLDRLNFDSFNGGDNMHCNTKQIQYFDSALNDSDLETLTSWTSFTDLANGQLYSIK